jgi:hypothetical protein
MGSNASEEQRAQIHFDPHRSPPNLRPLCANRQTFGVPASLPAVTSRSSALRYHLTAECLLKRGGEFVFRLD